MREGRRVLSVGYAESVGRYLEDFRPDLVLLDLYLNGRWTRGQEFRWPDRKEGIVLPEIRGHLL